MPTLTCGARDSGELSVLASGDPATKAVAAVVFDAVGASTRWVSDTAGDATAIKLVRNSWVLAVTDGVSEALASALGLGIDPQLFLDAIKGGGLDTPYAHIKGAMMLAGTYPVSFPAVLAEKDAGLIVDAAAAAGVPLSVAPAVRRDL